VIPRVPIPQGPILDYVKSEYQGEGHAAKQRVVRETADLANKILASYAFYVEGPETVTAEHRAEFRTDIERYGKRAVELQQFALQSDAPNPSEANLEAVVSAQKRLPDEENGRIDALLEETLAASTPCSRRRLPTSASTATFHRSTRRRRSIACSTRSTTSGT